MGIAGRLVVFLCVALLFRQERLVAGLLVLVLTVGLLAVPGFWIWLDAFFNWQR